MQELEVIVEGQVGITYDCNIDPIPRTLVNRPPDFPHYKCGETVSRSIERLCLISLKMI